MIANIEESSRGGDILLYQEFRYRKNLEKKDTIYWRCCVGKCHTPIRTNDFKNSDAIRVDVVGNHNHPGDRPDAYDDNRRSDNDADDEVLGTCSDTYIKWSNRCPNRTLDDKMQYEKSKGSRAGMCDDYEREKNIKRKNVRCVQKKMRRKVDTKMVDHT